MHLAGIGLTHNAKACSRHKCIYHWNQTAACEKHRSATVVCLLLAPAQLCAKPQQGLATPSLCTRPNTRYVTALVMA
jgi:hypothetical protein